MYEIGVNTLSKNNGGFLFFIGPVEAPNVKEDFVPEVILRL
jgi:hypothetical protein